MLIVKRVNTLELIIVVIVYIILTRKLTMMLICNNAANIPVLSTGIFYEIVGELIPRLNDSKYVFQGGLNSSDSSGGTHQNLQLLRIILY